MMAAFSNEFPVFEPSPNISATIPNSIGI